MRTYTSILVSGGNTFAGVAFLRHLLNTSDFPGRVVNLDASPAGASERVLKALSREHGGTRYFPLAGSARNAKAVEGALLIHEAEAIVSFPPEDGGAEEANATLLDCAARLWRGRPDRRFHAVGLSGRRELAVFSYAKNHGLYATASRSDLLYGPGQSPLEPLPRVVLALLEGRSLLLGEEAHPERDWLRAEDHAAGLWAILQRGEAGGDYALLSGERRSLLELSRMAATAAAAATRGRAAELASLVRAAPSCGEELVACDPLPEAAQGGAAPGWAPGADLEAGLRETVEWYIEHRGWTARLLAEAAVAG